jgi:hypothetical protein
MGEALIVIGVLILVFWLAANLFAKPALRREEERRRSEEEPPTV